MKKDNSHLQAGVRFWLIQSRQGQKSLFWIQRHFLWFSERLILIKVLISILCLCNSLKLFDDFKLVCEFCFIRFNPGFDCSCFCLIILMNCPDTFPAFVLQRLIGFEIVRRCDSTQITEKSYKRELTAQWMNDWGVALMTLELTLKKYR